MIVRGGKESQKWLQEYSCFNMQEMQSNLLNKVHKQHSQLSARYDGESATSELNASIVDTESASSSVT